MAIGEPELNEGGQVRKVEESADALPIRESVTTPPQTPLEQIARRLSTLPGGKSYIVIDPDQSPTNTQNFSSNNIPVLSRPVTPTEMITLGIPEGQEILGSVIEHPRRMKRGVLHPIEGPTIVPDDQLARIPIDITDEQLGLERAFAKNIDKKQLILPGRTSYSCSDGELILRRMKKQNHLVRLKSCNAKDGESHTTVDADTLDDTLRWNIAYDDYKINGYTLETDLSPKGEGEPFHDLNVGQVEISGKQYSYIAKRIDYVGNQSNPSGEPPDHQQFAGSDLILVEGDFAALAHVLAADQQKWPASFPVMEIVFDSLKKSQAFIEQYKTTFNPRTTSFNVNCLTGLDYFGERKQLSGVIDLSGVINNKYAPAVIEAIMAINQAEKPAIDTSQPAEEILEQLVVPSQLTSEPKIKAATAQVRWLHDHLDESLYLRSDQPIPYGSTSHKQPIPIVAAAQLLR